MDRSGGEQTRKDRKKMYFRRNYKKSRRPVDPSCKVFVGNISYRVSACICTASAHPQYSSCMDA